MTMEGEAADANTPERRARFEEVIRRFCPFDDTFLRRMLRDDQPLVEHILQIVTGDGSMTLVYSETQRDVNKIDGSRSVELDVYAIDDRNRQFDLEVENRSKRATPKRMRYHSGAIDHDILFAKQDFEMLPEVCVIFITPQDPLGMGLPRYYGRRHFDVGEGLKDAQDGTLFMYVNGEYRGDDALGQLMHDFSCSDPDDMLDEMMAARVRQCKEESQEVNEMCDIMAELIEEAEMSGEQHGEKLGVNRIRTLFQCLARDNRQADFEHAMEDDNFLQALFVEYKLVSTH